MKNLIEKLFKKEPQLKYIIPEYQPMDIYSPGIANAVNNSDYELEAEATIDEMQIDKIYRSL